MERPCQGEARPESQLPFGSVPFRHTGVKQGSRTRTCMSQLPFGSVPFRHGESGISFKLLGVMRLNYLSAQCPFGTDIRAGRRAGIRPPSQLPFGSVPFRHKVDDSDAAAEAEACLNYLSAQCPFGTVGRVHHRRHPPGRSQLPFGSVPFRHGALAP